MKLSDLITVLQARLSMSDPELTYRGFPVVGIEISSAGRVTLATDTGEDEEDEV